MRKAFILWWVIPVAFLTVSCKDRKASTEPGNSASTSKGQSSSMKDPKDLSQPPDFEMTADEYFAEWQTGADAARKKFSWKVIQLTGTVAGFRSGTGQPIVDLALKTPSRFVGCGMSEKMPWDRISIGQGIKLRGQFVNMGDPAQLYHCVVVEATGPKTPTLTAAQLTDEYDANPAATSAKYKDKGIVVKGIVDRVEQKAKHEARIYFRTEGKSKLYGEVVTLTGWHEKLKPGDAVRLVGNFAVSISNKDELILGFSADAGPEA